MGLCDAVAMAPPSAERCLTIIATPGVLTMSRSMTSTPLAVSADTAASRTQKPLGRESRPKTTRKNLPLAGCCVRFNHVAKAADMRETTAGVSVPPMVPRIPEIPIINTSISSAFRYGQSGSGVSPLLCTEPRRLCHFRPLLCTEPARLCHFHRCSAQSRDGSATSGDTHYWFATHAGKRYYHPHGARPHPPSVRL